MKNSQFDTKLTKISEIFQFSKILCIFPNLSTDFVDWNVEKGQQERKGCLLAFLEEIFAIF